MQSEGHGYGILDIPRYLLLLASINTPKNDGKNTVPTPKQHVTLRKHFQEYYDAEPDF